MKGKGTGDIFAIMRFCYIEVLFHIFYYYYFLIKRFVISRLYKGLYNRLIPPLYKGLTVSVTGMKLINFQTVARHNDQAKKFLLGQSCF